MDAMLVVEYKSVKNKFVIAKENWGEQEPK